MSFSISALFSSEFFDYFALFSKEFSRLNGSFATRVSLSSIRFTTECKRERKRT